MMGIGDFGAGQSFLVGTSVGALNPEEHRRGIRSAAVVAAAQLPVNCRWGVIAIYTLVAPIGVATPIIVDLRWVIPLKASSVPRREWLDRNSRTVMAVIYLLFGVIVLGKEIAGASLSPVGYVAAGLDPTVSTSHCSERIGLLPSHGSSSAGAVEDLETAFPRVCSSVESWCTYLVSCHAAR
jgi:hypothetical protein